MHRNATKATVPLLVVFQIFICAGVASAETKVACVGDSITEMPGWCMDLGTKLGAGHNVGNFGVSGTNLAKNVGQPYWTSRQYKPGHDFAPNIVIIMLGTNDSIPANWNAGKSHFVADYEELIDTYTSLTTHPRVYSILPPPIGTSPFGHDGSITADQVIPAIKQVAMEKMVTTIDVFTAFGGKMFDASLFGAMDQVHPSAKGHQLIADTVYAVLMSSGGLGGAGTGAIAGAAGSANTGGAGASGRAGASASTGGTGGAIAIAAAGASASPAAAGAGSPAATGAITSGSVNAGSSASTRPNPTPAGTGASTNVAGNTGTAVNSVAAAGTGAPLVSAADSSGCSCRMAGHSTRANQSGPTAALLLVVGVAIRSRKRRDRARSE